jgi:hypothetical protein
MRIEFRRRVGNRLGVDRENRGATIRPSRSGLLKLAADAEGEDATQASARPTDHGACASYHAFTGFCRTFDDTLADGRRTFDRALDRLNGLHRQNHGGEEKPPQSL